MVYISLLSGSSGFIYFVYSPRNYPYSTSLWSECRTLALEALDLSSSLLSEKPPLDVSGGTMYVCVEGRGGVRGSLCCSPHHCGCPSHCEPPSLHTLPQISVSDGIKAVGYETRVGTYEVTLLNTQLYPM